MKVEMKLGATIDALTPHEFKQGMAEHRAIQNHEREKLRGAKMRRIPPMLGAAVAGVLDIGGDIPWPMAPGNTTQLQSTPAGPPQGYGWWVRLLSVGGLTAGLNPDVVNLLINGQSSNAVWWQFNGNNFAYTFGRGELLLMPGETLHFKSVGAFAATGQVTVVGNVLQEPAEMIGRI